MRLINNVICIVFPIWICWITGFVLASGEPFFVQYVWTASSTAITVLCMFKFERGRHAQDPG